MAASITVKEHPTEEKTVQIFFDTRDETSQTYEGDITRYPMLEASIDNYNRTIEYKGKVYPISDIGSFHDLDSLLKPTLEMAKEMERGWKKDRLYSQYQELGWNWRETRTCPEGFVMRAAYQIKAGDVIAFTKENPDTEASDYSSVEQQTKIVKLPDVIYKTITLTNIVGQYVYHLTYIEDGEEKSFTNNGCSLLAVKK